MILPAALSVIVVTWNSSSTLEQCLRSLWDNTQAAVELIVVDNASLDTTVEAVEARAAGGDRVKLIRNTENVGFPTAVNQGLEVASAPYVLLLNPDVLVGEGAVDAMLAALQGDAGIGAVGPKVVTPEGSIQLQCARRLPTLLDYVAARFGLSGLLPRLGLPNRLMSDWDHGESRDVECLSGACVMVRTEELRHLGGLIEEMYLEDVELCWQVSNELRKRVHYLSEANVTHHHSVSFHTVTDRTHYLWLAEQLESSGLKFLVLHGGWSVVALARAASVLSGLIKLVLISLALPIACCRRSSRERAVKALYRSYVRLAVGVRGPRFGISTPGVAKMTQ